MKRILMLSFSLALAMLAIPALLAGGRAADAEDRTVYTNAVEVDSAADTSASLPVVLPSAVPTDAPSNATAEIPSAIPPASAAPSAAAASPSAMALLTPPPSSAPYLSDADASVRVLIDGETRVMSMYDYVVGATAAEMPPSFPREALRAQAMAVRTLAYNSIAAAKRGAGKHSDADICADPGCCMGYNDPDSAAESVKEAVGSTDGLVILYDGEPILAAFCAATDGHTKSSAEVWGGVLPYLVSVESPGDDEALAAMLGGHGVGMSQYGARTLAEEGASAEEIVRHYYTGVSIGYLR